jgi:hypothetical protein
LLILVVVCYLGLWLCGSVMWVRFCMCKNQFESVCAYMLVWQQIKQCLMWTRKWKFAGCMWSPLYKKICCNKLSRWKKKDLQVVTKRKKKMKKKSKLCKKNPPNYISAGCVMWCKDQKKKKKDCGFLCIDSFYVHIQSKYCQIPQDIW